MTLTRFWLWYVSFSENLMLRNMADGTDGYNLCCADLKYDSYLYSSVICLYCENNFEVLFCSAKVKVLCNLFFSHDCGFYHLRHMHFHIHESYRKEEVISERKSGFTPHFFCFTYVEPIYLYLEKQESSESL